MILHNNYNNLIMYNKLKIKIINYDINKFDINKSNIILYSQLYNNTVKIYKIENNYIYVNLENHIYTNMFNINKCIIKINNSELDNNDNLIFGLIE